MKIPVYYTEEVGMSSEEFISLSKPREVMKLIADDPMADVLAPEPLLPRSLARVHSAAYVHGVTSLMTANGFGNTRADVLKQIMAANSCYVSAARAALVAGIAFAPVSGFHHAGYDMGWGFCTFNGLMVAAAELIHYGHVDDVLILDFDGHYGDGTAGIIDRVGLEKVVINKTRGHPFDEPYHALMSALRAIDRNPGLVMLQAGADSCDIDPYGAGYFTRDQWIERDKLIFEACKKNETPVVWNLAGGYAGKDTIDLHYQTWLSAKLVWS